MTVDGDTKWPASEIINQVKVVQKNRAANVQGAIFFKARNIWKNDHGLGDEVMKLYGTPSLSPAVAHDQYQPKLPVVKADKGTVQVSLEDGDNLRWLVVYKQTGETWKVNTVTAPKAPNLKMEPGKYAVTAVSKGGVESEAAMVEVK